VAERVLMEVVVFSYPGGTFYKASYPDLAGIRITLQGGRGAPASDGSPGKPGEMVSKYLPARKIPARLDISVGRGGLHPESGIRAEDGSVLIELYRDARHRASRGAKRD
jgi:hypothetical protein